MSVTCTASRHAPTSWSYKVHRCRCPETIARMRAVWLRPNRVPGFSAHQNRSRDPYVDEIAVERVMRGDVVELTPAERREAARRLTAKGWSAARIAWQIGVAQRTVVRYRAEAA